MTDTAPITTPEEADRARTQLSAAYKRMAAAHAAGDYARRSEIARSIISLEEALNAYEATHG